MSTQDTKPFTLRIKGSYGPDGGAYGVRNMRYSLLRDQVKSWEDLLAKGEDPVIELQEGSLCVVFHLLAAAFAVLVSDLQKLEAGDTGVSMPSRLTWYNRMMKEVQEGDVEYEFYAGDKLLCAVNKQTVKKQMRRPRPVSVQLSTILYGKVNAMGGKSPNMHLQPDYGEQVVIDMSEEDVTAIEGNVIFKHKYVKVSYVYNIETGETDNYKFEGFVEPIPFNAEAMKELAEAATPGWEEVGDVAAWLREMRGDTEV